MAVPAALAIVLLAQLAWSLAATEVTIERRPWSMPTCALLAVFV